jgi:hypothetical protein
MLRQNQSEEESTKGLKLYRAQQTVWLFLVRTECTEVYRVGMGCTEVYRVGMGCTEVYRARMECTEVYRVRMGCTEEYRVGIRSIPCNEENFIVYSSNDSGLHGATDHVLSTQGSWIRHEAYWNRAYVTLHSLFAQPTLRAFQATSDAVYIVED